MRLGWGETGVVVVWIWGKIVIHISSVLSRRVAFTGFNMVGKLDMDGMSMSKDMLPWKGLSIRPCCMIVLVVLALGAPEFWYTFEHRNSVQYCRCQVGIASVVDILQLCQSQHLH